MTKLKTINVDYIARVEGQGALDIKFNKKTVDVKLKIFEPPRFFEAFLIGRRFDEVHELTSRICGICPVAHQITSLRAIENALELEVSKQTRDLRKILALSAIMNSHVLSLYYLTLPDYFKHDSLLSLSVDKPEILKRTLRLKKLANDIGDLIGGRAVHPVYAVVNGFTNIPKKRQLETLKQQLKKAQKDTVETVRLFSGLEYPKLNRKCEQIAISNNKEYAINEGRMKSMNGLDADESEYRKYIEEEQILYSYAKGSIIKNSDTFLVGPLARFNLNFHNLSDNAKDLAKKIGFTPPRYNIFDSILARAIEVVHAIDECNQLIDGLPLKEEDISSKFESKRIRTGIAITEAPRGMLFNCFKLDKNRLVKFADIVPPTAHNAKNIEKDLEELIRKYHDLTMDELTLYCEMLVRAYDPCISCSVH